MDYVGNIFRPPSEARSLLLQVTVGCAHNRCTYCHMYGDKRFSVKPHEQVLSDLREASRYPGRWERLFLCDGDALTLSTSRLLKILEAIREHLPWIQRVGTYGDTRGVAKKSVEELRALREAGLGIVYHGMESGDDEVLRRIDKGGTRAECLAMADKLREAGIKHSVMVLLGVGGEERSQAHAEATASALTAMQPDYVGALVTTLVPGTPLAAQAKAGQFTLPDKFQLLAELRTVVAESDLNCRFSANHASNYLPIRGTLPQDAPALTALLDAVLDARDERLLTPEGFRGL